MNTDTEELTEVEKKEKKKQKQLFKQHLNN